MIELDRVSKEYQLDSGIFAALTGVTLSIASGEFMAIVGPSGCGKSTLMHILGLLDRPTAGSVKIQSKDVSGLSDEELSHLRNEFVGFVFQQFNLIPKMTVLENVLLPTFYAKRHLPFDPRRRALELLTRFGIADKANSRPNRISGGQQQRTAIARALLMNPKLILADEPTGNLDSKSGEEILSLLTELNAHDRVTVVIVTHDPAVAKRTKRKISLKDGRIV